MEELQTEIPALALAEHGFKVFPLSPNSKVPLKGTHGYKDATDDLNKIFNWILDNPKMNLGIKLDSLLVVDVDMHGKENGRDSLLKLARQGKRLPTDTYIEETPNNGLHYFFKYEGEPSRKVNVLPGIDLLTDFTVIAPSKINGKSYKPVGNCKLTSIRATPQWLIEIIQQTGNKKCNSRTNEFNFNAFKTSKYKSKIAGELVKVLGCRVNKGGRNEFLTRACGLMFSTTAKPDEIFQALLTVNTICCEVQMPTNEIKTIYKSILRRELDKERLSDETARKITGF